ncbi:MAG TPA: PD-(D/E)XK nuclease family protein, partial [Anaerolineae bacterium]|nr:PD-(D/E)XK nuclease family protein [Anaerolineae bacterium]
MPSGIPYDQQVEEEQRVQPTASPACPTCGQPMLCTPAGWSCLTPHEQPALDKDAGELSFSLDSPTALPAPPALQLPVAPQPIMSADAVMAQQAQTQVLAPAASPAAILIDKAELSAQERAANALPLLEDLVLPGGITLGTPPATEDAVDVDAVLAMIDGYVVGPSSGGFSSHILADTVCARRTYLKYVLGLEPIAMPSYFKFGTLMHAVLAMRYMHGESRQWEPCDRVAQAGAPSMAAAVKRLLTVQFTKYQKEEYETWCPRAIEHNLIAWLPVKVGKKTVAVPLTCRVDMILGLKKPSEVHPGPGPLPQGIYLLDWKTTSGITYDLVEGYGSDFQFLLQSAIFELGGHARDFGPLRGILVSIAEKQRKGAKKEPDFDSFQRIEAPISKSRLAEFINYELTPMVTDFYNRLDSDELRAAGHLGWPKDIRHCISRWGRCSFYDYCERGNTAIYKMEPSQLIVLSEMAKPPTGWRPEAAA